MNPYKNPRTLLEEGLENSHLPLQQSSPEGDSVGKDDEVVGNSASEQNQKDMEEKIISAEEEIEKIAKEDTVRMSGQIHPEQLDDFKEYKKGFLERGYRRKLQEENRQKEEGDTGPSKK